MSKFYGFIATMLFAISLMSCSKDDDGFTVDGVDITGTWVSAEEYASNNGKVLYYCTINSYGEICCYLGEYEIQDDYVINEYPSKDIWYITNIKDNSFYADLGEGMTMTAKVEVVNKNTIRFIEHVKVNYRGDNSTFDEVEEFIRLKGVKEEYDYGDDDYELATTSIKGDNDNDNNNGNDGTGNGDSGDNNGDNSNNEDNNGNNDNSGNEDGNGNNNNDNTNNADWNGNWQTVTDNFSRSTPFRKIRVLNKQSSSGTYCCISFSTTPDVITDADNYFVNFYTLTIGEKDVTTGWGKRIADCTDVGGNWYEYEFSTPVYFAYYQDNAPRGQVKVLAEYQTR